MANTLVYDQLLTTEGGISRREFVKGVGAAVAAAALLAIGGQLITTAQPPQAAGEALVRSTFAGHLGKTFQIRQDSAHAVGLQLVQVRDLLAVARMQTPVDSEQNFSLLFRGPLDQPLAQGTYSFEHIHAGGIALLIAPMRPKQDGRYYEAIFNRLREPARSRPTLVDR